MDRKTLGLVAGLLAAAVGLFFLWRGVGGNPAEPKAVHEADGTKAGSTSQESARGPLETSASTEREAAHEGAARPAAEIAARTETFSLGDAGWIEGTVRFPKDAPPDETLQVWAFEDAVARGFSPSENDLPSLVAAGRIEKGWWSRRPVEASGAFRLPAPNGAAAAAIVVDGRFLYLERVEFVDLGARKGPLLLEPELGARIVGRCVLPPETAAEDFPVGAEVRFLGLAEPFGGEEGRNSQRDTWVGPDLAFELRGVAASTDSQIVVGASRLLATDLNDLALHAGRTADVRIDFRFGARIRGRVVDESGAGIENARLGIDPDGGVQIDFAFLNRAERPGTSAVDGAFEMFAIPPGRIRLSAVREGFVEGKSDPLELADRDVRDGITIVLSRGHSVRGTVAWPDGSPAVGASVAAAWNEALEDKPNPAGQMHPVLEDRAAHGKTGERGEFTISGLSAGPVILAAKAYRPLGEKTPGENLPAWTAELSGVALDSKDVALVLRAPIGLAGSVIDDLGAPVRTFFITASSVQHASGAAALRPFFEARTQIFEAASGSFQLTGLQPGTWKIGAKADGYVQLEDPPEVDLPRSGPPLVVSLVRAASASGLVLDPDGQPVARARVCSGKGGRGRFSSEGEKDLGETDAAGAFSIKNLPPGSIQLSAKARGFALSEPWPSDLAVGQKVDGVVLRLRRGGRLTGEVYDERGGRAVGRGVLVMSMSGQDQRSATVDESGSFLVESLAPGAYQVIAMPTEAEQMRMSERSSGSSSSGPDVDPSEMFSKIKMGSAEIREGETTHVVLGAPPRAPVRLFGRVTRAGEVVTSGTIVCIAEGGSLLSRMKMGTVRETGDYSLVLDEPGAVVVTFQGDLAHAGTNEFHATIPAGMEHRLDLDLPTGGLRGVVRGPDSAPLTAIEVKLLQSGGRSSLSAMGGGGNALTDEAGRFEFTGLAPGIYGVSAGGPGTKPDGEMEEGDPPWGRAVRTGIDVGKDKTTEGVELRLARPSRISGVVRDTSGQPVSNAAVFVRDERGEVLHRFSGVTTDASGRFVYRGVAAGRYVLFARTKTLASSESGPVSVHESGAAEVELTAVPGSTLLVSVEDKDGAPLQAGFSVQDEHGHEMAEILDLGSVEGLLTQGISSTEDRIGPLPPGAYKVTVTTFDGKSASRTVELRGQDERSVKLRIE